MSLQASRRVCVSSAPPAEGAGDSDIEARVLEVEVALDPAHDLVADLAGVAHLDDGVALRRENLPLGALIALQLLLERAAPVAVEALAEAVDAEAVEAAQPGGCRGAHGAVRGKLLDALERRLGGPDPRVRLLLVGAPVVFEAQ